jgi:two-component system chemotaxis response regulator CheB
MAMNPVAPELAVDAPRAVLAIGGSAGSLGPLQDIVGSLPYDSEAAVLIVMHVGSRMPSQLPQILGRSSRLPAVQAEDGEPVRKGWIYVAPPGRHLLAWNGVLSLSSGPRVNRHRPAVDVLFATVANWTRDRAVAVVLSGVLDDGAVGAALIARAGGRVLVQDPGTAAFDGMPSAALAAAPGARSLTRNALGRGVAKCIADVSRSARPSVVVAADKEDTLSMIDSDDPAFLSAEESTLTRVTCPECGGAMAQVDLPQISYFRCHVGHQYSPQTLVAAQAEASEAKLWSAVAALEEQAVVARYLARLQRQEQTAGSEPVTAERADEVAGRAAALRDQVRSWALSPGEDAASDPVN